MKKLVKVCGMRQAENIKAVEALEIDMMGFIFYPKSPRFVPELPEYMPKSIQRVGVFVNETEQSVEVYARDYGLSYIQLHGNETPAYCRSLQAQGLKLIKAFSIGKPEDLEQTLAYEEFSDYLLFDTPSKSYGGSGESFNWELLDHYQGSIPFLLSGGINVQSSTDLNSLQHPLLAGYDINSRFEIEPGLKDVKCIQAFLDDLQDNRLQHNS